MYSCVEVLLTTTQEVTSVNARIHFFAEHQDRLTVFQLPSYSPDYNPIEYLWRKTKKRATHNRVL
jgi:transposase